MTSVTASNTDLFAKLALPQTESNNKKELGQEDFIQLLIAELKNQDPTSPQDSQSFMTQLAQFSQVDGIQNMQKTLESFLSNQTVQATSLVGRQIQVESSTATLTASDGMSGAVKIENSTNNVALEIFDANGNQVKSLKLGNAEPGNMDFKWDGTSDSGDAVPAGIYYIRATGTVNGEAKALSTLANAKVRSVTLGSNGSETQLNLENNSSISFDAVKKVF